MRDVIGRPKFHADDDKINYFINLIEAIDNRIVSKRKIDNGSRDKSDDKYIECGLTAQVDYIIALFRNFSF
jgi:predicted nucleic acid-binding protein